MGPSNISDDSNRNTETCLFALHFAGIYSVSIICLGNIAFQQEFDFDIIACLLKIRNHALKNSVYTWFGLELRKKELKWVDIWFDALMKRRQKEHIHAYKVWKRSMLTEASMNIIRG